MTYLNFPVSLMCGGRRRRDHKQITGQGEQGWAANSNPSILAQQNLSIRKQAHCFKDLYNDEFSLNTWDEHSMLLLAWRNVYTEAIVGRNA